MSTPQSTTGRGDGTTSEAKKFEQITFRFCSECSNMLYPKEDEDAHKLQFTCRTCQYTESAQSSCVFRNVLNNSQGETAGVTQDVGSDPTVSLPDAPILCLFCGHTIHCTSCGMPSSELCVAKPQEEEKVKEGDDNDYDVLAHESLGFYQFQLSPYDNDPFAEYDEEPQEDRRDCDSASTASSADSASTAPTSIADHAPASTPDKSTRLADGSMVIDL